MTGPAEAFARAAPGVQSAELVDRREQLQQYQADIDATDGTARILTLSPDASEAVQTAFREAAGQWHNPSTHPNVVSVYDRGTEPRPWIAVAPVDGRPLDAVRNDLSVPEIRSILSDVAEALRNAALYNTTHGALSPENIWVTETETGVQAIVDDWGLERACQFAAGENPTTPFTAPQLQDTSDAASEQADVYSLGAVTYYALTGHPPKTPVAVGEGGPAPPSSTTDHPEIDEAVDDVVMTALAADPDNRYDSAYTFESAITRVLPTESLSTHDADGSNAVGAASDTTDTSESSGGDADVSPSNATAVEQNNTDSAGLFGLASTRSFASVAAVGVVLLLTVSLYGACFLGLSTPQANSLPGVDCAGSGESASENGGQPMRAETDTDATESETTGLGSDTPVPDSQTPVPNSDDSNSDISTNENQPPVSTALSSLNTSGDSTLFSKANGIEMTVSNGSSQDLDVSIQNETAAGSEYIRFSSSERTLELYSTNDYLAHRNSSSGEIRYGEPNDNFGIEVRFAAAFTLFSGLSYVDIVEWQQAGTTTANGDIGYVYEATALNETALNSQEAPNLGFQQDEVQSVSGRMVLTSESRIQSITVQIETPDGTYGSDFTLTYDSVTIQQPDWVDESQAP